MEKQTDEKLPEPTMEMSLESHNIMSATSLDDEPAPLAMEDEEEHYPEGEQYQEPRKTMVPRVTRLSCAICCGSCLLIVGIVCLVLGLQGFFTFQDPCVGMHSLMIKDLSWEDDDDSSSSSLVMGLLDSMTGGAASAMLPSSRAVITLEMIVEVNNTNPYDLDYEQNEEGTIAIPASAMYSTERSGSEAEDAAPFTIPPEHEDDMVLGTWAIPDATLKKKARNEIPITITATIDLADSDTLGMASMLIPGGSGGDFMLRIKGGIEGSSWVPGLEGQTNFLCLAKIDNILSAIGKDATVRCRQATKIAGLVKDEGDMDIRAIGELFEREEEVDSACFV